MHGLFNELLPPSGVDYAVWLRLTGASSLCHTDARQHLVVARGNRLRIFELREETRSESTNRGSRQQSQSENATSENNEQGKISPTKVSEGASRKSCLTPSQEAIDESTDAISKLHLLREHRLHGVVSGLQRVRMVSTEGERIERLLISFRDAKVCFG
jgi:cleavage and polyadenylation specificity factor subunit 1